MLAQLERKIALDRPPTYLVAFSAMNRRAGGCGRLCERSFSPVVGSFFDRRSISVGYLSATTAYVRLIYVLKLPIIFCFCL